MEHLLPETLFKILSVHPGTGEIAIVEVDIELSVALEAGNGGDLLAQFIIGNTKTELLGSYENEFAADECIHSLLPEVVLGGFSEAITRLAPVLIPEVLFRPLELRVADLSSVHFDRPPLGPAFFYFPITVQENETWNN